MATIQGQSGPQILQDGVNTTIRTGRTGELNSSDAHARFQEAVYRGSVFVAANQSGGAITALNATCTGLVLTNPAGSGKNLVIWEIGLGLSAAPAADSIIQLAANVNTVAAAVTQSTPLTIRNALLGTSGTPVGLAASSVTLPAAPVAIANLFQVTAASAITPGAMIYACDGKFILTPGSAVSLSATSAASGAGHIVWEEILI